MAHSVSMFDLQSQGKSHVFGWIIFTVTVGTFILLIADWYNDYSYRKRRDIEEAAQERKLNEVEMNLRTLMGNEYKSIS